MSKTEPIALGGAYMNLGTPSIQTNKPMSIPEVDQRAKASDVTTAINYVHGELALLKAEVIVFRMVVASHAETSAKLAEEARIATKGAVDAVSAIEERFSKLALNIEMRFTEMIARQIKLLETIVEHDERRFVRKCSRLWRRIFG